MTDITMPLEHVAHVSVQTHETHAIYVGDRDTGIRTVTVRGRGGYRAELRWDGRVTPIHSPEDMACAVVDAVEKWKEARDG